LALAAICDTTERHRRNEALREVARFMHFIPAGLSSPIAVLNEVEMIQASHEARRTSAFGKGSSLEPDACAAPPRCNKEKARGFCAWDSNDAVWRSCPLMRKSTPAMIPGRNDGSKVAWRLFLGRFLETR